eukprot:353928-Chlamydomonas_euryale.AAC.5
MHTAKPRSRATLAHAHPQPRPPVPLARPHRHTCSATHAAPHLHRHSCSSAAEAPHPCPPRCRPAAPKHLTRAHLGAMPAAPTHPTRAQFGATSAAPKRPTRTHLAAPPGCGSLNQTVQVGKRCEQTPTRCRHLGGLNPQDAAKRPVFCALRSRRPQLSRCSCHPTDNALHHPKKNTRQSHSRLSTAWTPNNAHTDTPHRRDSTTHTANTPHPTPHTLLPHTGQDHAA